MVTEERIWPDVAIPPGETLAETLAAKGISQAELARRAGRPQQAINEIVQGKKAITAETALDFERVLGVPQDFWVRLEANYQMVKARLAERKRLGGQAHRAKLFPYAAMARNGWVAKAHLLADRTRELLSFFGVSSLDRVDLHEADWRRSRTTGPKPEALAAWLRQGERQAETIQTGPYDPARLKAGIPALRRLTMESPQTFQPRLVRMLADAGVACVFVRELPGAGANGATRWSGSGRAIMQVSLRYKWADILWFTVLHELGHVLLHPRRETFVEFATRSDDEREREADRFAADALIDPARYQRWTSATRFSRERVRGFASELGIHAGIVVGRLQYDGKISRSTLNDLRERLKPIGP